MVSIQIKATNQEDALTFITSIIREVNIRVMASLLLVILCLIYPLTHWSLTVDTLVLNI